MFSFALLVLYMFFFFNDTATTEIYTLSLHDALPILVHRCMCYGKCSRAELRFCLHFLACCDNSFNQSVQHGIQRVVLRSEEHTSELQSRLHLVCRLLLEKKKKKQTSPTPQ